MVGVQLSYLGWRWRVDVFVCAQLSDLGWRWRVDVFVGVQLSYLGWGWRVYGRCLTELPGLEVARGR